MLLPLSSCGNRGDWAGDWKGNHGLPGKEGDHPGVVVTMNVVRLSVDERGRFVLIEAGLPRTGTISMDGDTAELVVKTKLGSDVAPNRPEPRIQLRKLSANELELNDPGAFVKTPVKLRRETRAE